MKNISMALACTLIFVAAAFATTSVVMVTGAGTDNESDMRFAHDNADSLAQTNLQNACPGTITTSRKIFDMCSPLNDSYTCSINYSGMCQVGY
jgi:hypothetical protein